MLPCRRPRGSPGPWSGLRFQVIPHMLTEHCMEVGPHSLSVSASLTLFSPGRTGLFQAGRVEVDTWWTVSEAFVLQLQPQEGGGFFPSLSWQLRTMAPPSCRAPLTLVSGVRQRGFRVGPRGLVSA